MALIFGLDLGTTSIGSAVIEHDPDAETGVIHHLGARIFPEARDPKGKPLNQNRREKRMIRRQLRRRRARRRMLNEALARHDLLPTFDSPEWRILMRSDPIELRVRGLTDALSSHELGRALYHLAHRRHYRERDLEDAPEEADPEGETDGASTAKRGARKAKAEKYDPKEAAERERRTRTVEALRVSGQTLAQHLQELTKTEPDAPPIPRIRQRGLHVIRANVADEFERLWTAQASCHPILRNPDFRAEIEDTIFAQRPVFWRPNTLGRCPLMPAAALAPKASWLSQQRRMLEKLNNLAIVGGNSRPMEPDERALILAALQTQAKMTWGGVRACLKPLFVARGEAGAEKRLRFNHEDDKDKSGGLLGNPLEAKLAAIFGDGWAAHPRREAIREQVPGILWSADYTLVGTNRIVIRREAERRQGRAVAMAHFMSDFGATQEQARRLANMRLPTGWEPYSTDALRVILPELERGERFGALLNSPDPKWIAWRDAHFSERDKPTGEILSRLPSPADKEERERLAALRNPTVVRVQNELRKVVNNLIAKFGLPDLIRIELARDIGLSGKQREEKQAQIRANTARRAEAVKDLLANDISEPSSADIEKWMLWKECGGFDPYSGGAICFDGLFRTNAFEVEHIFPRSKSFDNSMRNKTLCAREWNQRKGQRTPYEAFGHTEDWGAMSERVWKMVGPKGMPKGKAKRFCHQGELDQGFVERQLNDTGYSARQAMAQLRRLWPNVGPQAPVTVQPVTGRVTAHLRRLWGLNHILADDGEKTRADHRHHAVDALVVACAGPEMTNRLSRYFQQADDPAASKPVLAAPWSAIRADAEHAVAGIVVSHRVRRRLSGALHKGLLDGDTREDVVVRGLTYRYFVARTPVEDLIAKDLAPKDPKEGVRDLAVRAILRQWIAEHGGDAKKAFGNGYPRIGTDGPEIKRVRLVFKRQSELMVQTSRTGYAEVSTNHHIAIYRKPDGTAGYEVVSLHEAARRAAAREPVVRRQREDGWRFLFSLSPGDALEFPDGEHKGVRVVQGVWASGQVVMTDHKDATGVTVWRPNPPSILASLARKVTIDPIGRKRLARD